MVQTSELGLTFLYGEVSVTKNNLGHFLPGIYIEDQNGQKFHPGYLVYSQTHFELYKLVLLSSLSSR